MPAGYPVKVNYLTGDVLTAADLNDLAGTVNLYDPTAKGDLFPATAADTVARLSVGANNTVLTADSAQATGMKWAAPAAAASGLTLVGSNDFTTSSSVVVTSCFSATYSYYLIYFNLSASTDNAALNMRLRVSGTSSATGYDRNRIFWSGASITASQTLNATSMEVGEFSTSYPTYMSAVIELLNPEAATITDIFSKARFLNVNADRFAQEIFGNHTAATAYDSVEFIPSAGNMSGTVRIYGYAKS